MSAEQLVTQGDKKLKGGMMSMFTGVDYGSALECYEQAANAFKIEGQFERAAEILLYKVPINRIQ